uniref:Uncharacterized protein n=1 Tax=Meloidogyne incognita TaxID=6306 RepID=A0A914NP44_MELIC
MSILHVGIKNSLGYRHKSGMGDPSTVIPSEASRSLSFLTAFNASSLAVWSCLMGICAAIPPIAKIFL